MKAFTLPHNSEMQCHSYCELIVVRPLLAGHPMRDWQCSPQMGPLLCLVQSSKQLLQAADENGFAVAT